MCRRQNDVLEIAEALGLFNVDHPASGVLYPLRCGLQGHLVSKVSSIAEYQRAAYPLASPRAMLCTRALAAAFGKPAPRQFSFRTQPDHF